MGGSSSMLYAFALLFIYFFAGKNASRDDEAIRDLISFNLSALASTIHVAAVVHSKLML
jgi:hypothetical protein